jgi:hypothetical protein
MTTSNYVHASPFTNCLGLLIVNDYISLRFHKIENRLKDIFSLNFFTLLKVSFVIVLRQGLV